MLSRRGLAQAIIGHFQIASRLSATRNKTTVVKNLAPFTPDGLFKARRPFRPAHR